MVKCLGLNHLLNITDCCIRVYFVLECVAVVNGNIAGIYQ